MKKTVLLLLFLISASACLGNSNPYTKFVNLTTVDTYQLSLQSNCFVFRQISEGRNVVLDRKNGLPVLVTDNLFLSLSFDETDSTFVTEKFSDGVRSLEKKDKHGTVTALYTLPDTFPAGPSFCNYIYGNGTTKALYSLDKRKVKFYDLEQKKQLAEFSFPTQEAWDEVKGIRTSEDLSRIRISYTNFDVFYDMHTGDSLCTTFPRKERFSVFTPDGEYYFLRDSVFCIICETASSKEMHRWEDSLFLSVGWIFNKTGDALLLTSGDTLYFKDWNKALTHHNKKTNGTMYYAGDEIMFYDELNQLVYKYNGDTAYSLARYHAFPLRYTPDEKSIVGVLGSNAPLNFWSSSIGRETESSKEGWYSYNWNDTPIFSPRFILDPSAKYVWYVGKSKIGKYTLGDEQFVDSISIPKCDYWYKRANSDVSKIILQEDTMGRALVVDLTTKAVGTPFVCPAGIVQLSPDGNTCLAIRKFLINWESSLDGFSLYSTITGQKILDAAGCNNNYTGYGAAAYAPDSRTIAIADSTDTLRIFSTADGSLIRASKLNWAAPSLLNYSPDGKHIVYTSDNGEVGVLEVETGRTQFVYNDLYGVSIRNVVISPSGRYLLAMGFNSELAEWVPDWNYTPVTSETEYFPAANCITSSPNPIHSTASLTLCCTETGIGELVVFGSLGERVAAVGFDKASPVAELRLDCSGFAKGVYLLRASIGGKTVGTGKVVVE